MKIYTQKQWEAEIAPYKKEIDTTAFDNACLQFKTVCNQIKQLLQLEDFKGGFDQMSVFQASQKANTIQGIGLAMKWSALNQLCKYEGSKLGYGQPQWWYKCWNNDTI